MEQISTCTVHYGSRVVPACLRIGENIISVTFKDGYNEDITFRPPHPYFKDCVRKLREDAGTRHRVIMEAFFGLILGNNHQVLYNNDNTNK